MSHDRGCYCGREKYEYADCDRKDCLNKKTVAVLSPDVPIMVLIAAANAADVVLQKGHLSSGEPATAFMLLTMELIRRGVNFDNATATKKETGNG